MSPGEYCVWCDLAILIFLNPVTARGQTESGCSVQLQMKRAVEISALWHCMVGRVAHALGICCTRDPRCVPIVFFLEMIFGFLSFNGGKVKNETT